MGMTHSRSEDLYKRSVINSGTFINSITDTPGYFSQTFQTMDFVERKFPNNKKPEMSYDGPPSHLQNSIDVHPFWSTYGREFLPTDRFNDMSSDGDVPRGLLPGTDTVQEMRNLELKESMKDLRSRVKEKMAHARPIPEERVASDNNSFMSDATEGIDEIDSKKPSKNSRKGSVSPPSTNAHSSPTASEPPVNNTDLNIDKEEKLALDFLDSIISESMDLEEEDTPTPVDEDSNWSLSSESFMKVEMRRRNLDKPVPGVMQEVAPSGKRDSFYKSNADVGNGGISVLRTSMYLPDAGYMNPHSSAAKANVRNSQVMMNYHVEIPAQPNPTAMKAKSGQSDGFLKERTLSNGDSNTSTDTGVFSGSSSMNSEVSSHASNAKSRGQGVQNLVRIYNEQSRHSKTEQASKRRSANLDNMGRAYNEQSRDLMMEQASKRRSANFDNMGRPNGRNCPLGQNLSQPKHLPQDDGLGSESRAPRDSAILDEIRQELQFQLYK